MKNGVHIAMWFIVGLIVVAIMKNGQGFATATSAVGGQITNNALLLTGAQPAVTLSQGNATIWK